MSSNAEPKFKDVSRRIVRVETHGELVAFRRRSMSAQMQQPRYSRHNRSANFDIKRALPWIVAALFSVILLVYLLSGEHADPLVMQTEMGGESATLTAAVSPVSRATIVHKIRSGDNWQSITDEFGIGRGVSSQLQQALDQLPTKDKELGQLKRGQDLELTIQRGALLRARLIIDLSKSVVFEPDLSTVFRARFVVRSHEMKERVLLGVISPSAPSFSHAATEAGVSYDTVDDLVDLFGDRINFRRDFRMGDRFTVVYRERVLDDETVVAPGPILAAIVSVGGKRYVAVRYVGSDGVVRYFDEEGKPIESGFLRYPLKFSKITSEFTYARFHPILNVKRPHNGVDFAAPTGAPVRTVADGVVVFSGWKNGGGNTINISHGDRYETEYMHLSKITPGLKKGDRVKRGELIGAVGSTGLATGPHLHFGFKDGGKYVNPLKINLPTVDTLTSDQKINSRYLTRVLFTLRRYQGINREVLEDQPT